MKNLKFKKTRLIANLSDIENKKLFHAMNFALIIGGICLISAFLLLIANLDKADVVIFYCLPGFILGLVLVALYAVIHQKLTKVSDEVGFAKSRSFGR